ncbi:QRFP-like peptide receptor [Saccoglossus kowalevskii]|uniref:Prolactin-releasing peptide receptor-like n=1 Tax=Saccoglossus kowalevskii TaxID=10224 RepID=A0ABM0GIC2_SACKO|nr:PREDICTED: prolactin-releasing peptide receptor-like [Saccoglossus kowalevskii]
MSNEPTVVEDYTNFTVQQWRDYFRDRFNITELLYTADDLAVPVTEQIFLMVVFVISMTLAVVGNVLVICVLTFGTRGWTELNIFLINLSLADLTMAIFCMPFTFPTIMKGHWIFGDVMCPVVLSLQQVSICVSIYTLTAMSVDRYYAVLYPFKLRVTKNRAKYVVCLVWLVSISLSLIPLITARSRSYDLNDFVDAPGDIVYFCSERIEHTAATAYELVILIITYVIPLSIISYTYYRIGRRLWGRSLPGVADRKRDLSQMRSKKKTIKMLVVIVVMFAICWFPLHVFNIVNDIVPDLYDEVATQDIMRITQMCCLLLATANSFMNPFIYGFLNETFRKDLKHFVMCRLRQNRRQSIVSLATKTTRKSSNSSGKLPLGVTNAPIEVVAVDRI